MIECINKENCTKCAYHDIFWESSGCNLLNNMEHCKFEPKNLRGKNIHGEIKFDKGRLNYNEKDI